MRGKVTEKNMIHPLGSMNVQNQSHRNLIFMFHYLMYSYFVLFLCREKVIKKSRIKMVHPLGGRNVLCYRQGENLHIRFEYFIQYFLCKR